MRAISAAFGPRWANISLHACGANQVIAHERIVVSCSTLALPTKTVQHIAIHRGQLHQHSTRMLPQRGVGAQLAPHEDSSRRWSTQPLHVCAVRGPMRLSTEPLLREAQPAVHRHLASGGRARSARLRLGAVSCWLAGDCAGTPTESWTSPSGRPAAAQPQRPTYTTATGSTVRTAMQGRKDAHRSVDPGSSPLGASPMWFRHALPGGAPRRITAGFSRAAGRRPIGVSANGSGNVVCLLLRLLDHTELGDACKSATWGIPWVRLGGLLSRASSRGPEPAARSPERGSLGILAGNGRSQLGF